jgi:hypothetical protein
MMEGRAPAIAGLLLSGTLLGGTLLSACGDTATGSQILVPPRISEVNITPDVWQSSVLLEDIPYSAEVLDQNGNVLGSVEIVWSSEIERVATIDSETGVATTRANGVTAIRADAILLTSQGDSITGFGTSALTVLAPDG